MSNPDGASMHNMVPLLHFWFYLWSRSAETVGDRSNYFAAAVLRCVYIEVERDECDSHFVCARVCDLPEWSN